MMEGGFENFEVLGVLEIHEYTVGHGSYKALAKKFPHVNPKVFEEVGLAGRQNKSPSPAQVWH